MNSKIVRLLVTLGCFVTFELKAESMIEQVDTQKSPFSLPPLPYAYEALEPNIDARTVEIHYSRHHNTYVANLNKAVAGTRFEGKTLRELFADAKTLPTGIRNNGGGHWNHSFYWDSMTRDANAQKMSERLKGALEKNFGSVEKCKELLKTSGLERFGSGYAWLIQSPDGKLQIISTPNQDNPLMNDAPVQGKPLLVVDVWEHAYYLKYQNKRGDYLDAFWYLINWANVDRLLFGEKK
jgi:Fe-Mn family superoxide dismutase